tara:strand:+ start:164 stop:688 length:525 start_codon:yes stop_codon:yes gene_type:complete
VESGNEKHINAIIAFAFGCDLDGDEIRPGVSNEAIASIVVAGQNINKYPPQPAIIVQREINDVFQAKEWDVKSVFEIRKHRVSEKYLDTQEVAEQAAEIMHDNDWQAAVVVAHHGHVKRCIKCLEKLGIKSINLGSLQIVPYNKDSSQWWTRSWFLWWLREIPTRAYYKLKGWA